MRWMQLSCRLLLGLACAFSALSCGGTVAVDGETGGGGNGGAGAGAGPATSTGSGAGSGSGGSSLDDAAAVVAAKCPDVAAEPHFCITLGYPNTVWAVGPDTGHLCPIGTLSEEVVSDISSIAVVGTRIHGCGYDIGTWRASILGGPPEILNVPCAAITGYQGGFLHVSAELDGFIDHYATFEDIQAGAVIETFSVEAFFSRISARESTLYTAWHSTDTIDRYTLPSAAPLAPLLPAGFDDWVNGMSVTQDGRLYILSSGNRIEAFDSNGNLLQTVNTDDIPGGLMAALHCWSN